MYTKIYISIIAVLFTFVGTFAQQTTKRSSKRDTLKSDVIVVRAYDPTVSDANKIDITPNIQDSTKVDVKFNYYVDAEKADAEFEVMPIKAAKILPEPLKKLYHSNLSAGFGNYYTPYVEYSYSSLRSKKNSYSVHLKHLSSAGKLKLEDYDEKVFAGYSNNLAEINTKHFVSRNSTVTTGAFFNRDVYHNYGFLVDSLPENTDSLPDKDEYKQRYWSAGANIRYMSNNVDSNHFNFNTGIAYNYLENLQNANQHTIEFDGNFNKFHKKEMLGADIFVGTYLFDQDTNNNMRVNIGIKPFIKVGNKKWLIKAGLDVISDVYDEDVNYHFYPNVFFKYNIVETFLTPYIGIFGRNDVNHYSKIIKENPYITNNLAVQNTNNLFIGKAGFKGKLSKSLSYNLGIDYSIIDGMYFFVNDTAVKYDNTFTVEYDNVELTTYTAEVYWAKTEKLNFVLKGEYFQYKMDSLLKPWHKPEYEITLSTRYNLRDKFLVNFDVFAISQRYAKNMYNAETPIKLDGTVDINLGIEYRYNKLISAFVKLNNIAAVKYYKFNQYPTQRFNAMVGLSYSF